MVIRIYRIGLIEFHNSNKFNFLENHMLLKVCMEQNDLLIKSYSRLHYNGKMLIVAYL